MFELVEVATILSPGQNRTIYAAPSQTDHPFLLLRDWAGPSRQAQWYFGGRQDSGEGLGANPTSSAGQCHR